MDKKYNATGILDPMGLENSRKESCRQLDASKEVNSGNRIQKERRDTE